MYVWVIEKWDNGGWTAIDVKLKRIDAKVALAKIKMYSRDTKYRLLKYISTGSYTEE